MTTRDRLTLAAALAVALASAALRPVYEDLGWLLPVLGGIVAVSAAAALARLGRAPRVLQPVAGALALAAYVTLVFAGPTMEYGLLPTWDTLSSLTSTARAGLLDVEQLAPPVPTSAGLVLLAVLGTGAIAVAVDLLAVTLRKVAASGLPLLLLFAVPAAVLPDGLGLLAFVLGAAGWLGILLADGSDRASRWGAPLRSSRHAQPDPSLGRAGRRIGVAALGVAAVVPALVPGLDGRLLGGSGDGPGIGGARTTTTYNPLLSLAGQLRQPDPQALLTYTSDQGPAYLRLTTLDVFDADSGWSSSELSADIEDDAVQDGVPEPDGLTAPQETLDVEVDLTRRLAGPWLPVPATPSDVEIDGPWLWDEQAETVFSTRTSLQDVEQPYTVRTVSVRPDADLLRRPQTVPDDIEDVYAVRPDLSDEAQELLEETTKNAQTDYDRVAALQSLFRDTDFVYSEETSVPPTNAPDALTAFLQTRQGFCEQYASAMAALVRGLGIPARVAVGFTAGDLVGTGRYSVTTREAHAWPEVWFRGAGWVRFEPTPRAGAVDVPDYSIPPVVEDESSTASASPSAAPGAPTAADGADPGATDRASDQGMATGLGSDADTGASPWWLALPGAVLLLLLPALLAGLRRAARWRSPDAVGAWAAVQDDAVDVGHGWRPTDSPRAAAARLLSARPLPEDAAAALDRLATGAERARYARTPAPADAAQLKQDAGRVRAALLAAAAPRDRWVARLAPPSTMRWAGHSAAGAVADRLERVDVAMSTLGARLRHPRRARVRRAG